MPHFKRKQRAVAEIHLSLHDEDGEGLPTPTNQSHYLSHETIQGCVLLRLPPGVETARCQITLKGAITTETPQYSNGAFAKEWRTETLAFLAAAYDRKAHADRADADGAIRLFFHFDLSECEKLSRHECGLPPSVDSRRETRRPSDVKYSVDYSIKATVTADGHELASTVQRVDILAVSLDSWRSSAPGAYFWAEPVSETRPKIGKASSFPHARPRFRTGSSSHSSPERSPSAAFRTELAAQETDPLVLQDDHGVVDGETEIPFVVKVSHGAELGDALPAECKVHARLVTKTHLKPDEIQRLEAGLEFPRKNLQQITRSQNSNEQSETVSIAKWEPCVSCNNTDSFSVARFTLPFHIHDTNPPMPTFSTPLLSRDHFIELTASFPDGPTEAFKVSVPVEIVHGLPLSVDVGSRKSSASSGGCEARL